jgi:hypothetical protein
MLSDPLLLQPHTVFNIVVDNEVQLFLSKPIVFCENPVDVIASWFLVFGKEFIIHYISGGFIKCFSPVTMLYIVL